MARFMLDLRTAEACVLFPYIDLRKLNVKKYGGVKLHGGQFASPRRDMTMVSVKTSAQYLALMEHRFW